MKESTKGLAERLDKQRAKNRKDVADWRKKNYERAKQHYKNWIRKKKGTDFKPKKLGAYYGAFDENFEEVKRNEQ